MQFNKFTTVLFVTVSMLIASCASVDPGSRTIIEDSQSARQLLGQRPLSLQWISWDDFGTATVSKRSGQYFIAGEQRSRRNNDYLTVDGKITRIAGDGFSFDGTIEIQVEHLNGGNPYRREGAQEFRLYGNRRFWRLVGMENPDGAVDYVDIFHDMAAAKASPDF